MIYPTQENQKPHAVQEVPVVDLSAHPEEIVSEISRACSTFGFFQVINFDQPSADLLARFRKVSLTYFAESPKSRRSDDNARGYFDDEYTKQKLDWKQCLDVGMPGSRDWNLPDEDLRNSCLDGVNRFPPELPELRKTIVEYFQACESLSNLIAKYMAQGIDISDDEILHDLKNYHTSYLRLNYYPRCQSDNHLGISPHRDAGFLTILLQDDACHSLQVEYEGSWQTIIPERNALTINTGDMAQIWSNGIYQAPLHRVLTNPESERFSAPFFFNPGYQKYVRPIVRSSPKYSPCLWGYFRGLRFAGDFTDLGVEIQVSDFETNTEEPNIHLELQKRFEKVFDPKKPFGVEDFRRLLQMNSIIGEPPNHS